MSLTNAQLQTLKSDILADPVLSLLPNSPDGNVSIAKAYNTLVSSPAPWIVWRTEVGVGEIMLNGFGWTRVDNLSVGKARIWEWMTQFGTIDASKENIRAGIDATWVGTQADLNVRAAVYLHCKREATRAEKLFSTGTGTTAEPATMTFEGPISSDDVEEARNLV